MKRIKYLYKTLPLFFAITCLSACDNDIKDIDKVEEHLQLSASATSIALDKDNLEDDIITFSWTDARFMSDEDYIVSYETKLDIVGNNFGTATAILTYEDEGVYSKSFTSEQIQNWANQKWKQKVNKPFTLEFRVVVQWEGGPTFEAPEVRTVTVDVQPIKVEVFDADKMFVGGSALPEDRVEMSKTLENESQYAWLGDLDAGELQIPVILNGETYYIIPADGDGTLQDGEAETVKMQETPISWNIQTAGEYRVVVNMENSKISIYSPDKALKPAVVKWMMDGEEQATIVDKLWRYGTDGWGWKIINFVPSLADPQILIYKGDPLGTQDRVKFGVAPNNQSYVYSPPLNGAAAQDITLSAGETNDLAGESIKAQRDSYFKLPKGTNFIIIDIRNMKIRVDNQ